MKMKTSSKRECKTVLACIRGIQYVARIGRMMVMMSDTLIDAKCHIYPVSYISSHFINHMSLTYINDM